MFEARDMFLSLPQLEARTRELEGRRFIDMTTIAPLDAMEGALNKDLVYRTAPERVEGGKITPGDEFIGRDRYLWARKTVTLPAQREGCEVYGLFDFGKTGGGGNSGFESLLYVDGHPFQGVDTNHTDVNFNDLAGKVVELTFLLWTGLEGGGPKAEHRHLVRRADIGYLHKATDEFYYLAKAIYKELALLPDESPEKHGLTRALDNAFRRIDWDEDRFHDTVPAALESLNHALAAMEKRTDITVSAIGHTHIDVAWLWRLKHTREKAMRSFSTVLKLMDEFDEYVFLQTEPQLYKYLESDCPELYEKVRARVAEGRWEADGGMWLEADCNISSGEALVRQFLHGIRYFQKAFGRRCEYLWLPDVFGYSWALPQILKGFGIETFMTTKISWNQFNTMPHDLFRWRGIDGSEVMTYFITTPEVGRPVDDRFATYNGMLSPRSVLGSWKKFHDKALSSETLISYGFGDGGGGVNRNMLKMRRAMDRLPGLPNVKTSRAGDFFRRLHERLDKTDRYVPVWDGELYLEYHRGTYTSQARSKRMNRTMEFAAAECEWLSSLALIAGGGYDSATINDCWETILRNQFHDIIPGSSIGKVYEDSMKEYADAAARLGALSKKALGALIRPAENAFTLYHFGSFPRRDPVFLPEAREGAFRGADGKVLRTQRVEGGVLVEAELGALRMGTVHFEAGASAQAEDLFQVDLEARELETPFYRIQWNEEGALTRVYDKENTREAIEPGACANVLEVYEDKPIQYENWDLDIFHQMKRETVQLVEGPAVVERGALRLKLRFRYAYRRSTFTQDMTLYASSQRIDFVTHASWHEDRRLLKAAFPVAVRSTRATYDIQFGHAERPTHFNTSWDYARFEVVAHKWSDLSEAGYGVSILNDCKYGHSTMDNVLRITLLKSGKYPDTQADMGEHDFTYALLPHAGGPADGGVIEEAEALNLPVRVLSGAEALSALPVVSVDSPMVHIDAVKRAEDEDCLIVRVHECRGGRGAFTLTPGFPLRAYAPVNLLEENLTEPVEADRICDVLSPFEIKTFKLWWK